MFEDVRLLMALMALFSTSGHLIDQGPVSWERVFVL